MNVFLYRKKLYIPDKIAKRLHLTVENPHLGLWEDPFHRFFLTHTRVTFKKGTFHGYCDCTLEKEGWSTIAIFPFPWEQDYSFQYLKYRICLLERNKNTKEIMAYESRVTPIPIRRRKKTKKVQDLCYTEQTKNRQDPHITNTLI